jgi:hypothetical protein
VDSYIVSLRRLHQVPQLHGPIQFELRQWLNKGEIGYKFYQSSGRKETSRLLYHASESWSIIGRFSAQKLQQAGLE